jgi:hypothetical protein
MKGVVVLMAHKMLMAWGNAVSQDTCQEQNLSQTCHHTKSLSKQYRQQ